MADPLFLRDRPRHSCRSSAQRIRPNAGLGNHDWPNEAARVELELVDAHDAMVAIRLAERTPMVDDVPLVRRRRMQNRMMARAGGHCGILLQDLADSLERTEW